MTKKAVILISGGLDSTTCLALAKADGYECYTLSVDYGQRYQSEVLTSEKISKTFGAKEHKLMHVNLNAFGGSALTDKNIEIPDYVGDGEIPITYVPARNTLFLSLALGYAEVVEADVIFIGVSEVDYSGYPDCRPEYIEAFQTMANLATKRGVQGNPIKIVAPLTHLSKAQTIETGLKIGVDYSLTVTCYQANESGQACARCDACVLRKKGFEAAGVADPTNYVAA